MGTITTGSAGTLHRQPTYVQPFLAPPDYLGEPFVG